MQDVYLWYDKLPLTFNTRAFLDPAVEMDTLRAVQPLDRWSFVEKAATFNSYFSNGQTGDFGFWIKYDANNDLRVRYVYAQSPAGLAGIKRGWKLTTVNGQDVKSMTTTAIVDAFYGTATSATFGFEKPDGTRVTGLPLTVTNYTLNTVLYSTTYTVNGNTVGYLVFNSFTGTPSQQELATIMNRFESAGINDLIIDLRYNGGGDVSTQEYLANRLVPGSVGTASPMYSVFHNAKLSSWNKTVNFAKTGNLSLSRIFFITTAATASASELLINNLKPYLDVKTIGSVTHGKPVGMYGFTVMDYVLAPIAFRTVNAKNVGDYYNGLPVDVNVVDGLNSDWGDPKEACLAAALLYISRGTFAGRIITSPNARQTSSALQANSTFDNSLIKPMVAHPNLPGQIRQ